MGGSAFATLSTPRMPTEVYLAVKQQIHEALAPYFEHCKTPIEGGGKKDHGDVDILVCKNTTLGASLRKKGGLAGEFDGDAVGKIISAVHGKRSFDTNGCSYVVNWPEGLPGPTSNLVESVTEPDDGGLTILSNGVSKQAESEVKVTPDSTAPKPPHFIQVDIQFCHDLKQFDWILFIHAHGDFMNIMGQILRKSNIGLSNSGFYYVIDEVVNSNKKLSRVNATREASTVLKFLGLEESGFWRTYDTWDDFCAYLATCRFHDPGRFRERYEEEHAMPPKPSSSADGTPVLDETASDTTVPDNIAPDTTLSDKAVSDTTVPGLEKLDLNPAREPAVTKPGMSGKDRRKANRRPNLNYWYDVYQPAHFDDPAGTTSQFTREEVLDEMKLFFGEAFATRYSSHLLKGRRFIFLQKIWVAAKDLVKKESDEDSHKIGFAVKGLKRLVASAGQDHPESSQEQVDDVKSFFEAADLEGLMGWWKENWEVVEAEQREIERVKNAVKYAEKLAKEENEEAPKEQAEEESKEPAENK